MFEWLENSDVVIVAAVISAITSILVLVIGLICNLIYHKLSLSYKLKKEYVFEQKKGIKQTLAKTKTPLIKSAEEMNYRLWNLSRNINKCWLNVDSKDWLDKDRYYIRSTVYRFLDFIYWNLEAEKSIYSFDFSKADKHDKNYLKWIKTLKHFFCESDLLKDLGYDGSAPKNHFYKDNLGGYAKYIDNDGVAMSFKEFESKLESQVGFKDIEDVFKYMSDIRDDSTNLNYSTIRAFHLFLMLFLNKYGLDYHNTNRAKIKKLIESNYNNFMIKKSFYSFLKKNNMLKESRWIRKKLQMTRCKMRKNTNS